MIRSKALSELCRRQLARNRTISLPYSAAELVRICGAYGSCVDWPLALSAGVAFSSVFLSPSLPNRTLALRPKLQLNAYTTVLPTLIKQNYQGSTPWIEQEEAGRLEVCLRRSSSFPLLGPACSASPLHALASVESTEIPFCQCFCLPSDTAFQGSRSKALGLERSPPPESLDQGHAVTSNEPFTDHRPPTSTASPSTPPPSISRRWTQWPRSSSPRPQTTRSSHDDPVDDLVVIANLHRKIKYLADAKRQLEAETDALIAQADEFMDANDADRARQEQVIDGLRECLSSVQESHEEMAEEVGSCLVLWHSSDASVVGIYTG